MLQRSLSETLYKLQFMTEQLSNFWMCILLCRMIHLQVMCVFWCCSAASTVSAVSSKALYLNIYKGTAIQIVVLLLLWCKHVIRTQMFYQHYISYRIIHGLSWLHNKNKSLSLCSQGDQSIHGFFWLHNKNKNLSLCSQGNHSMVQQSIKVARWVYLTYHTCKQVIP